MNPEQERGLEHMQYHGASGGGPDPRCDFCRQRSLWWDYLWPDVAIPVLAGASVIGFLMAVIS